MKIDWNKRGEWLHPENLLATARRERQKQIGEELVRRKVISRPSSWRFLFTAALVYFLMCHPVIRLPRLAPQLLPLVGGYTPVGGGTVATPTDSPGAGTYGSTQSVTLSDATSSATICYTIDGSAPGAATPGTCDSSPTTTYSGAITVAATTTIKALGTKAGMTNSGVMTSVYTISAGITLVNGNLCVGGPTGGTTASFDSTGANFIAVAVSATNATTVTVTDATTGCSSPCNTYLNAPPTRKANASQPDVAIYYVKAPTVGAGHTITVAGAGTFAALCRMTWSGMTTSTPFDVETSAISASATSLGPGTVTPSASSSLILTAIGTGAPTTITVDALGAGFTQSGVSDYSAGQHWGLGFGYKLTGSAASPVWSVNSAVSLTAVSAVFK